MSEFWERAAQSDPLWAILSDPSKRGRKWDPQLFFETGRREVSLLLYQLHRLGHAPNPGRALDFGCGIGRLTQALATTFDEVVGVDVSPTMIRIAQTLNPSANVKFILNASDSLSLLGPAEFDFVYSDIVLQHLEPQLTKKYLPEFIRVLAPGGIAVFQLTSHKRTSSEITGLPVHMPTYAYSAALTFSTPPPTRLNPGESAIVDIELHNRSAHDWEQQRFGTLQVGNHWRTELGVMLIQDDGRTRLPTIMRPRDVVRLPLSLRAPVESGRYICEFDLVHEGISWFGDFGSPTLSAHIDVTASSVAAAQDACNTHNPYEPHKVVSTDIYGLLPEDTGFELSNFPMYGVPRTEVLELLHTAGASVFFDEPDERGGPEWHGYRYYVERSS